MQGAFASKKENSIRYGSSLRVRPGQAAVFLYQSKGDYDIIVGPYDDIIKADNMPVLASIVSLAYKGGTPFQAEVYFINMAKGMELPFTIPYFRVIPSEPAYKAYDIEVAVKGAMAFQVPTEPAMIKYFLEAWGTSDTTLEEFKTKVKALLTQEIKQIVANAPKDTGIFIMHFNQLIGEMGHYILSRVQERIMQRFGIFASDVLIEEIRYDEDSDGYQKLKRLTEDQAQLYNLENEKTTLLSFEIQRETMRTDADIRNQTAKEMAQMQMEHMRDATARMREEAQFAQHLQSEQAARQAELGSESAYINAHSIDKQTEVLKTGMENIGQMGSMDFGGGDGHMNPAGMMTGMMMGRHGPASRRHDEPDGPDHAARHGRSRKTAGDASSDSHAAAKRLLFSHQWCPVWPLRYECAEPDARCRANQRRHPGVVRRYVSLAAAETNSGVECPLCSSRRCYTSPYSRRSSYP